MSEVILSILVPSTFDRKEMLDGLLADLGSQIYICGANDRVEILTEVDNGEMSTGAKRNLLLQRAKGEYVAFVDSDDEVSEWYVLEILKAVINRPDAVGLNGTMTTNGSNEQKWFISKDLPYRTCRDAEGVEYFERYNNHLSPVRRIIALQIGFPDQYTFEDFHYAQRLRESKLIQTEVVIAKPLYHYRFISKKT
jgi:glycosyltransferase involved in cell wall biosynthesis